jgi:hypothetical protein
VSALIGDLPILDQVALHRVLVLAAFGIAMLAAFGLQHLLDGTGHRRMLIAAALAAAIPPLVIVGAHPSWVGELPEAVGRLLGSHANLSPEVTALASVVRWCVLAAATVGLAVALVRRPRRAGALAAVAVALAAFDLLAMGWGYNPAIPKEQADPPSPPAVEAMQRLTDDGGRVVSVDGLIPNTATRWGLHDARGHEQPVIERTTRLWLQLGTTGDGTVAVVPDSGETKRLLDAFGVRAALLDRSRLTDAGDISARGFTGDRVAYAGPGGVVVQRRSPLPPAFVAYNWRTSGNLDESLLHMALSSAEQMKDAPVIETTDAAPGSRVPATPARVVSRSDTEVTVEVRARARGQLVLLDSFYPGWRAEVDGRETPIRPANAAFRAVAVNAGRHEVRFSYRPASVIAGGAISVAAIALMAVALLLGRGRRGRRDAQPRRNPSTRSIS